MGTPGDFGLWRRFGRAPGLTYESTFRSGARQSLAALLACLACEPAFSDRYSHVAGLRVLGVQSTPAQVAPNGAVSYHVLVGSPDGTVRSPSVDWAFCTQGKATSELNDVSPLCFESGDQVTLFDSGPTASGKIPLNACRQFGPDIPQSKPGDPPGRPTDADSTGGYYQPVMVNVSAAAGSVSVLGETRLVCGLANATGALLEDFQNRTKPNENPVLSSVTVVSQGGVELSAEDANAPLEVDAGAELTLRASWPPCPATSLCGDGICGPFESRVDCAADCSTPRGCPGPEPYAYLDPALRALVDRFESMRVSWFASAGTFSDDHTGRLGDEHETTFSDNHWTAPKEPGPVFLWVVLRDDRGGVDWQSFQVVVR